MGVSIHCHSCPCQLTSTYKPAEAKSSAAVTTAKKVGGFASRMFKSGVSKLNSAVNGPEDKKESSPAYAQTRV
jgi:hypothetical protein